MRGGVFARGEEATDFGEGGGGRGVGGVVGAAGPEGVLVELKAFVLDAAEDHGAEAAIAERKGLDPLGGGLAIPEGEVGRGRRVGVGGW